MATPAAKVPSQSLHVLRALYRLLKTPPFPKELQKKAAARGIDLTSKQRSNSSTAYLMSQYRQAASVETKSEQDRLKRKAAEYFLLRRSIAERAQLYALDTGAEQILTPKEISRRAAARAGLQLPEENPPLRLD